MVRRLLTLSIFITGNLASLNAQTLATSQNWGTTGTCIGCDVTDPDNAVNGNDANYALMNLTASTAGSSIYQQLTFPDDGLNGDYVGVYIQADNLIDITPEIIAGVELVSYKSSVSNSDTKTASDLSIFRSAPGSTIWILEYQISNVADMVELKLKPSALPAAVNKLRIYGAYHNNTSLPVELMWFNLTTDGTSNVIKWATASETNCDYFLLERSNDGLFYEALALIKGAGNTSHQTIYSYIDDKPSRNVYYKLKQVDFDGTVNDLGVKFIENDKSYFDFKIFPNPSKPGDQLNLVLDQSSYSDAKVSLNIYDTSSRLVFEQVLAFEESYKNPKISLPYHLKAGVYSVILSNSRSKSVIKLIVNN